MSLHPDYIQAIKLLPPQDQMRTVALSHYLKKWVAAEQQYNDTVDKLKYESLRRNLPLQSELNALIKGERAPTSEEISQIDKFLNPDEKAPTETPKAEPFQHYWAKVFENCSELPDLTEQDLEVLKHCTNLTATLGENDRDFKLKFEFETNDYFENKVIEKEYLFNLDKEIPEKCRCTEINWKQGKNVTKKIYKKKQRNKKTGQSRTVDQEEEVPSFFHFFKEIAPAHTEQEEEHVAMELGQHLQVGEMLMEQVIPDSLAFYLGIAQCEGEGEQDDEEDEDEDEDEDEQ